MVCIAIGLVFLTTASKHGAGVLGVLGNNIVPLMCSRYIRDTKGTRYFITVLDLMDWLL